MYEEGPLLPRKDHRSPKGLWAANPRATGDAVPGTYYVELPCIGHDYRQFIYTLMDECNSECLSTFHLAEVLLKVWNFRRQAGEIGSLISGRFRVPSSRAGLCVHTVECRQDTQTLRFVCLFDIKLRVKITQVDYVFPRRKQSQQYTMSHQHSNITPTKGFLDSLSYSAS